MAKKLLEVTAKYNAPEAQLAKAFLELAPKFAAVKGLEWKVWKINQEKKSCGGVYLFMDEATVKAYLDSELFAGVKKHPALSDVRAEVFDVLPEHSKITRAPI